MNNGTHFPIHWAQWMEWLHMESSVGRERERERGGVGGGWGDEELPGWKCSRNLSVIMQCECCLLGMVELRDSALSPLAHHLSYSCPLPIWILIYSIYCRFLTTTTSKKKKSERKKVLKIILKNNSLISGKNIVLEGDENKKKQTWKETQTKALWTKWIQNQYRSQRWR